MSVSETSDPTGSWCGYEFLIHPTKFGDYPKFGVWPSQNAFFMTVNQFDESGWGGAGIYGFERDRMLACEPARFVYKDMYDVDPSLGSLLPADADGSTAPPTGAAIPLVSMRDGAAGPAQRVERHDRLERALAERHPRHRAPDGVLQLESLRRLLELHPAAGDDRRPRAALRPADAPARVPELRRLADDGRRPHGQRRERTARASGGTS